MRVVNAIAPKYKITDWTEANSFEGLEFSTIDLAWDHIYAVDPFPFGAEDPQCLYADDLYYCDYTVDPIEAKKSIPVKSITKKAGI